MPDEMIAPTPPATPPPAEPGAAAPPAPSPSAPAAPSPEFLSLQNQVADLDRRNKQYESIVTSMVQAQAGQMQAAPPQPTVVAPQARQFLRARGMSDEEIDQNAAIIGPFLDYAAQVAISPLQAQNQSLRDQVETMTAKDKYRHWDVVSADTQRILEQARQTGQPMTVEDAYGRAVVQNLDKVVEAATARNAAATQRASDASAYSGMGGSTAVLAPVGDPKSITPAQFAGMSREQRATVPHARRMELWNELGLS